MPSSGQVTDSCSTEASSATSAPAKQQSSTKCPSKVGPNFTEEQKAFVLYSSRHCTYAEVVSSFRKLFPARPVDEAKVKNLRKRLRHDKKELYLLNIATTFPWYQLVLPDNNYESEQPMVLGDCTEEQKSFLFYHYCSKGLQPLRIVELFNEHFSRAVTFSRLSNLFVVLELERKESSQRSAWLEIAQHSEWYDKYLPEPNTRRTQDQDSLIDNEIASSRHDPTESTMGLRSNSTTYNFKARVEWPIEHRVYLAWLGL